MAMRSGPASSRFASAMGAWTASGNFHLVTDTVASPCLHDSDVSETRLHEKLAQGLLRKHVEVEISVVFLLPVGDEPKFIEGQTARLELVDHRLAVGDDS